MSETTTTARAVTRLVPAVETSDGAGVRLRRSIGKADLDTLDPFLLLDAIGSEDGADYIAGFPDHPHRGFETVTYMIEGRMRHRDSTGAEGLLESGSVQWMTAGRGIVHSEMPEQEDGVLEGFQLWVNLPAAQKMSPPRYQDIPPSDVPEVQLAGGGRLRVVAGSSNGETGPVEGVVTAPMFLDFELRPGEAVEQPVTPGHTGFVY
ncbi:MAG: quercetin 2,3-dioxygenase, partial [Rhodospirillaceae bacterium]|nr:quercetin 2,3-dioxygenase [Rhodospirillaceae bacterium]